MNKVYVLSGYFAEVFYLEGLHSGHIKYINSVLDRMDETDKMIIICNNREQRFRKYENKINLNQKAIGWGSDSWLVNKMSELFPYPNVRVMISKSEDKTVIRDLETVQWFFEDRKEVVFVKDGGEYDIKNLPEKKVKGITFLFLQNPKITSATEIIQTKEAQHQQ